MDASFRYVSSKLLLVLFRNTTNLEPLEVEEALAEGVLQQVVVTGLDEGDEHTALTPWLPAAEKSQPIRECEA